MSSPLGDKKGRVASSSDLTRLRRKESEIAAYATYTGLSVTKKMHTQQGTTSGVLSVRTGAITLVGASTTGQTINPVTGNVVVPPYTPPTPPAFLSFSVTPYQAITYNSYIYYVCTASCTITSPKNVTAFYFAIGGGGGGGGGNTSYSGGGGGAGGLQTNIVSAYCNVNEFNSSVSSGITLTGSVSYTLVIGGGGAGGAGGTTTGATGTSTIFSGAGITTVTALGGGPGGGGGNNASGGTYGCGGGCGGPNILVGTAGTQGYGGWGPGSVGIGNNGGGGGGLQTAGASNAGGLPITFSVNGSNYGAGGTNTGGAAAAAGTGSGGSGGALGLTAGGAGGSGIFIISIHV